MNLETALEELEALANPARAEEMRAYHKADRRYLGLTNPQIADLAQAWREELDVEGRVALADGLGQSDIFADVADCGLGDRCDRCRNRLHRRYRGRLD